jgi:hypothetical protein
MPWQVRRGRDGYWEIRNRAFLIVYNSLLGLQKRLLNIFGDNKSVQAETNRLEWAGGGDIEGSNANTGVTEQIAS